MTCTKLGIIINNLTYPDANSSDAQAAIQALKSGDTVQFFGYFNVSSGDPKRFWATFSDNRPNVPPTTDVQLESSVQPNTNSTYKTLPYPSQAIVLTGNSNFKINILSTQYK
jgi:hypothetical protein